jgi:hypothetical protein
MVAVASIGGRREHWWHALRGPGESVAIGGHALPYGVRVTYRRPEGIRGRL